MAATTMQRVSDIEQKETTLLPQHRHGVLRLLMEHLRNGHRHAADGGGAAAAPRLPSVAACAEYVRALERQVFGTDALQIPEFVSWWKSGPHLQTSS